MRFAFLFPGQNSQYTGMGRALAGAFPDLRTQYFERADQILDFPLTRLIWDGPEEELVKTENQQPAIFLVSVAVLDALRREGLQPDAVAGHSLGEYAALVAAGALSWEDGLRLTRRRGEMMAEVAARTGGIMAAVLGLPAAEVEAVCARARDGGVVEVANFNSPLQTVISGEEVPVRRAMDLAREAGARRVIELNVSAPFHCSLMAPLAAAFRPLLDATFIGDAEIPVIANVTAQEERSPHEIRENLVRQLASAVRWTESVQRLIGDGITTYVEVGPRKVLTGLARAIDPKVTTYNAETPESITAVVSALHA